MESDQSASRAARRFLQDRVRNDWDWPNTPDCFSASDEEVRNVTVLRERFYATSSDLSSDESEGEAGGTAQVQAQAAQEKAYQFDDPDSVGTMMEAKEERRKRRRRERERREIEGGNAGLSMYVERRDAWTGVRSVRKYGIGPRTNTTTAAKTTNEALYPEDQPSDQTTTTTKIIPDPKPSPTTSLESTPSTTTPTPPPPTISPSTPALVPLAPPLLPTNAIRLSITPKSYPDIYQKIVLQSRTPAVPINLSDMSKALVQGWKEHGEWPPKSGPLDPLAGAKKKNVLAGIGLGGLGGHHGGGGGGAAATGATGATTGGGEAFLSHHPHLQKGVEHLQKMLHLRTGGHQDGSGGHGNGNGNGNGSVQQQQEAEAKTQKNGNGNGNGNGNVG